jgi:hypothetical protein
VGALAFELWTIDSGYTFDNVMLGNDEAAAAAAREQLWKPRIEAEVRGRGRVWCARRGQFAGRGAAAGA